MNNDIKCLNEKGKLSVKDFGSYLSKNVSNKSIMLNSKYANRIFDNISEIIIKNDEDYFYCVRDRYRYLIKNENLSPEGLDLIYKSYAETGDKVIRTRNLVELEKDRTANSLKLNPIDIYVFMQSFYNELNNILPVDLCKNIKLRSGIRKEVYCAVDTTCLTHILANLVLNALIHSHSPDNRIDIVINRLRNCNNTAVSVIDYGIGVDIDNIHNIINHRVNEYSSGSLSFRSYKGFGLLVCQRLADLLGGKIIVSNIEGGGAAFSLMLDEYKSADSILALSDFNSDKCKPDMNILSAAFSRFENLSK